MGVLKFVTNPFYSVWRQDRDKRDKSVVKMVYPGKSDGWDYFRSDYCIDAENNRSQFPE